MTPGFATPDGTANFAKKQVNVAKNHFKKFAGLTLSSVGIGTYLGNPDDMTDKLVNEAIKASIKSGINVIDTAINYRSQKAERVVGRAISEIIQSGELKREEIFISTKNGYVTNDGDVKEDFWINIQNTLVKPGVIQPGDISSGYHCMTIPYLQDQLKRSLKNMDLDCIDLIYIHNAAEGQLQDISKEEFIKKLESVFEFYEEQRRSGFIKHYGMATWDCFRVAQDNPQYLPITEIVELAKKVGGKDNGFRFIQLPYNMYLDQALTMKNQKVGEEQCSILEAAIKLGIGVFASVPLMQSKLLGPNIIPEFGGMSRPSHRAIQFVRSTPGIIAPLVGQKSQEHVQENLSIVNTPVLNEGEFSDLIKKLSS
ncbi:Aldo/keto reductase [Nitrosotalea sinensis]|uniref:Aldo/keto reductase n=1 Tax=Nitrosotalea sinensis TaxID=1499975 RepID=A0A2H1EIB6_9ARCH|nr:aldo/keto reductase [Candidatus Nitrosotalea sinensis]SHO47286.1 Aldo/keto reductase [Candidatus Nitrosotalea sinensis]